MSELVPGLVVANRYRLERSIGAGGMGAVWAASHMVTRRAVALKFLRASGESDESHRRFVREARAACAVMHPNVVEVLDFIELSETPPILVLELLAGESLGTLLARSGRLSLAEAAEILVPVVSAVGAAHEEGIVHRDLKPDNIFLHRERDGSLLVKVLDFGIAKVTELDPGTLREAGLTETGAVLGTPAYMSPEQVFGETDVDHRADVWALGIILYRCLSGVLPTQAPNVGQVYKIILSGTIKPIAELVPELPQEISSLLDAMLAADRVARPSDLSPVLAALQPYAKRMSPRFGPPRRSAKAAKAEQPGEAPHPVSSSGTTVRSASADAAPVLPVESPVEPRASRSVRGTWLLVGAAAAALGAMAIAVRPWSRVEPESAQVTGAPGIPTVAEPTTISSTAAPVASLPPSAASDEAPAPAARSVPRPPRAPRAVARPTGSATAAHPEDPYGF